METHFAALTQAFFGVRLLHGLQPLIRLGPGDDALINENFELGRTLLILGLLHALAQLSRGNPLFLRQLIDWGATPAHLLGTDVQQERLDLARARTAPDVRWHCGPLTGLPAASADLVSAHTVLSSVLDPELRQRLAADMWRVLKPGGWCLVFDFRYNNPRNPHVRKLTRAELDAYWPGHRHQYETLLLAPPIGRPLAALPALVTEALTALAPPLRSHFIYMAQKER